MKKEFLSFKRVNFFLDQSVYSNFKNYCEKLNLKMSKVLRDWIKNFNTKHSYIPKSIDKKTKRIEVLMSCELYLRLIQLTEEIGLNISQLARLVIQTNLNVSNNLTYQKQIDRQEMLGLWNRGFFKDLDNLIGDKIDILNDEQLFYLSRANIEMCRFEKVSEYLSVLKQKYLKSENIVKYTEVRLLETDALIHTREIEKAKVIAEECLLLAKEIKNSDLIGKAYFLLGDMSIVKEDNKSILSNTERAMDYLDLTNYPLERTELYLYTARVKLWDLDFDATKHYLERAYEIIKQTNNNYHLAWYYSALASFQLLFANGVNTTEYFLKSSELHARSGSGTKDIHYNYDIMARTNLFQDKKLSPKTLNMMNCSLNLEKSFRPGVKLSTVEIFRQFPDAEFDFERVVNNITKMVLESNCQIKPITADYVLNSAKFIFGPNDDVINQGRIGLMKLADNGSFMHIRENARLTLQTKNLQVVVR